jgi:hypothetical protein
MIGCIIGAFLGVAACQPTVLRCHGEEKFAGMTLPADDLITLDPASNIAETPFGKLEYSASETEFVLKAKPLPTNGVGEAPRLLRGSETVKSSSLLCKISRIKQDMWCEAKIVYDDGGELYRLPGGWNYLVQTEKRLPTTMRSKRSSGPPKSRANLRSQAVSSQIENAKPPRRNSEGLLALQIFHMLTGDSS